MMYFYFKVCTKEETEIIYRNSKASDRLRDKLMQNCQVQNDDDFTGNSSRINEGLRKALEHKNKLLEYDKTRFQHFTFF